MRLTSTCSPHSAGTAHAHTEWRRDPFPAVAHGADLLGAFGLHPEADPKEMLASATEWLVVPTDELFAQQEDDRFAQGIARTLTRPELSEAIGVHA
ncbi:DUF2785 domain-containing protein [Streptomyces sp. NPDC005828]|uniref:DUF2785 domain-containing protein n=1 Tax=Streptomyces sp. NPDC005828 TaxID=3157071 RepID=UPI00340C1BC7